MGYSKNFNEAKNLKWWHIIILILYAGGFIVSGLGLLYLIDMLNN